MTNDLLLACAEVPPNVTHEHDLVLETPTEPTPPTEHSR